MENIWNEVNIKELNNDIKYVAFVPTFINKSINHCVESGLNMDEVNFYTLNYLFLVYNKGELK